MSYVYNFETIFNDIPLKEERLNVCQCNPYIFEVDALNENLV